MNTRSTIGRLLAGGAMLLAAACSDSDRVVTSGPSVVRGNGFVVEEVRPIGGFSSINHGGIGTLYIERGAGPELRIRAEENLLEHLKTEVQAGRLVIWKDGVTLLNTHPIEYHLTVVDLEAVSLTGAGGIHGSNLDTGPLDILRSGVGNVDLVNLTAPSIDVESSGVGTLVLSGSVQEQTIRLSGLGSYDGRNLSSAVARVLIGSGGSATVRVSDHLSATFHGSGNVYYIGDPIVTSTGHGSGKTVKIGG